ncbi:MAG: capsular polysaccharide biosynthesis protein [Defluviitaleaceae bacterium]|nr:capsular polysaccharide biosynthesis protein [Defluviitaleaceae bacterium]
MFINDYHTHILPNTDDGAKDIAQCAQMLQMSRDTGVERVFATPHFMAHRESVQSFLQRRQRAFDSLPANSGVFLGAEVSIERGLAENNELPALAVGGKILLELPYTPFKDWMVEEIYNITYTYNLTPVLAHIERYLDWYSPGNISDVLAIPKAAFQINSESLQSRRNLKFVLSLIRDDYPVVFGSDAHNTENRKPNLDIAYKVLKKKLSNDELSKLITFNLDFI